MGGRMTHVRVRRGVAASMVAMLAFGSAPALGAFANPAGEAAGAPSGDAEVVQGKVLRVGNTADAENGVYASLAGALAAAQQGATVILDRDIAESVTVDNGVTIDGQGKYSITGLTTLSNGTLQDLTLTTDTANILKIGSTASGASATMKNVTVSYPVEKDKRAGGSVTLVGGNNAQVVIDHCAFTNKAVNSSAFDASQWSYGFVLSTQGEQGSLTFTNNTFNGAFRTMLSSLNGEAVVKGNTFTNSVYTVADGPTTGAGNTATCITTDTDTDVSEIVIENNVFDNAGCMYFQQTKGAVVKGNRIKASGRSGHYIQVAGGAGSALDLHDNQFELDDLGIVIYDTVGAPAVLPAGVRAISAWPWVETPNNIKPTDYSSYAYSYDASGNRTFYPSSEGALKAFLKPAAGNIGVKAGDTIKLEADITAETWNQIWNVSGVTIDGGGHTLKVNKIESGDNHNAIIHSAGGNTVKNLTIDLSALNGNSKFGYRAFDAAPGDSFTNVTIKGNDKLAYGISMEGTDAAGEKVAIDGCVFENIGQAVYDSETGMVDSLSIKNSSFKGCDYSVIMKSPNGVFSGNTVTGTEAAQGKLNVCAPGVTVTGSTFAGKCRIKFYAAPLEFKKNNISEQSYLAKDSGLTGAVDISENYWGGGAPSATQVPAGMKDAVTGADVWYEAPTMRPSDLNTYVPPVVPPSDKTEVEHNTDGSTTTTVTKPDGSQTVTTQTPAGTESVVKKDKEGNVTSTQVNVSQGDAKDGEVKLPVDAAEPAQDAQKAPEVEVNVPAAVTPDKPVQVVVPVAKEQGAQPDYGVVVFAVDEDGEEYPLPKSYVDKDGNVVFEATGDVTIKVVDNAKSMPDVKPSDWFAGDVVDFATARGIVNGVPQADGTMSFNGNGVTTRAMFVGMIHNLELAPKASAPENFDDVVASDWFAHAAAWGAAEGIVEGYGDGSTFGGGDPVTREQVAVFLMRYAKWLGMDTSARATLAFPDASSTSDWAREAMEWAVAEGLFSGYSNTGELRPGAGATRAQVATVLMRFVASMYE